MKMYKMANSSETLDLLEGALKYVLDNDSFRTVRKTKLMAIGVLGEYGVLEVIVDNVKTDGDQVFLKAFYEIWTGEYGNYGVGMPKNIPVYRGFVEGKRIVPWSAEEEVGTHKDKYGNLNTLVDLMSPHTKGMSEIGDFNGLTGNAIDIANHIKSLISDWGSDDSFEIDDLDPVPSTPSKKDLVHV